MNFQEKNALALRAREDDLCRQFPPGHFVAFEEGRGIANAACFDDLIAALDATGDEHANVLVVQAGKRRADAVYIVGSGSHARYTADGGK